MKKICTLSLLFVFVLVASIAFGADEKQEADDPLKDFDFSDFRELQKYYE